MGLSMATFNPNRVNLIMKSLHHAYNSTIRPSRKIQWQTTKDITGVVFHYALVSHLNPNFSTELFLHSICSQYWYDADIGLHHLLFEAYSLTGHSQTELKELARRYQKGNQIDENFAQKKYLEKHPNAKAIDKLYGYCFERESAIVNLLWNSFTAREIAFLWLNMYTRIKGRYAMEVKDDAIESCKQAKRLCYLLHGVILADNKMHISRYKNMSKTILTKQQWIKLWNKYAKYDGSFWD